jgi:micrococcal nuclease
MVRAIMFLMALMVAATTAVVAAPIDQRDILVIEGDLIRIQHKRPDVTLLGFNAPEVLRARCRAEKAYGQRAARRLREIVRYGGNLEFERLSCPCPPNLAGTRDCNRGRSCGRLKSNGRDVGDILIAEKLAVPFQCGAAGCPPVPRPWCAPMGIR